MPTCLLPCVFGVCYVGAIQLPAQHPPVSCMHRPQSPPASTRCLTNDNHMYVSWSARRKHDLIIAYTPPSVHDTITLQSHLDQHRAVSPFRHVVILSFRHYGSIYYTRSIVLNNHMHHLFFFRLKMYTISRVRTLKLGLLVENYNTY